jgi:hypothetical protein
VGGKVHLADDRLCGQLLHLGTFAMADRHETHVGERLHRLADGRAADAEAIHQFALGGHGIAGPEVTLGDQPEEALQHLVRQFAAGDTLGLHRHWFGC